MHVSPNRACTDGVLTVLPCSLDLTNFVVRSHRGATAEPCAGYFWLTALNLEIWESGNPGIWKSGNPTTWKSGIPKSPENGTVSECKSVLPKMSAGKTDIGSIFGNFRSIFPWTGKMQNMRKLCLFSLVGQWLLFTRFGVMRWCHKVSRSSREATCRAWHKILKNEYEDLPSG